ncbi:enduracididine biosynthesis enzyme MppQ [Crossiella equi]|uniref:Enduracididine biosynthesis enzyme MppQ n=1 Tax=Crossiella equi TaxID=130796 RepID=A0ABS5AS06_9PSEU|nr:aminotransferase class I/II-fold pyridoxal phosphate-dependent enzyme [Crossiella equi]MBP2479345.1 enduracididine biosynthesis enzyme MppQ [Crossiella equi]
MSSTEALPAAHSRRWRRDVVQDVAPEGVLDLGPGYLQPELLPVDLLSRAYTDAFTEYGAAALSYGADPGALPLRTALARRAGAPGPEHVVLTAGSSSALYLLATLYGRPGQRVLVERQSYDLGVRLLADAGLRPRRLAGDADGPDPLALEEELARDKPAFLYLTPTFHNPTGRVMSAQRRLDLLAVARWHDLLVVEDDAYAELVLGTPPPPPMATLAAYRRVVRVCSFSKVLGPGLRLGYLLTDPDTAAHVHGQGVFTSGGSPNHTTSLAVATLLARGALDGHLAGLRAALAARRDALLAELPGALAPDGGFFLWLPGAEDSLLAHAAASGVRVAAGSRFGNVPGVRLAYSFNPPELLARAARLLAPAWTASPS